MKNANTPPERVAPRPEAQAPQGVVRQNEAGGAGQMQPVILGGDQSPPPAAPGAKPATTGAPGPANDGVTDEEGNPLLGSQPSLPVSHNDPLAASVRPEGFNDTQEGSIVRAAPGAAPAANQPGARVHGDKVRVQERQDMRPGALRHPGQQKKADEPHTGADGKPAQKPLK